MKIPLHIRQECIKLSSEKKTIQEVSNILNISRGSVLNIRKESNLIFNKLGEHKRVHFYNEDYFKNIDSPTKAYWLGFIFADGCLYSKSNCLSIGLARKDRIILEKFIKCIEGDSSKIFDRSQKSKKNGNKKYETSTIHINSKKIYQDLIN
jgi:DNA-binding CsgD family transcriptional regulator